MNWVALVMLLAALQSLVFGGMVGYARGKYQVKAPAISGNEMFERYFRVHYNTNELLIVLLPALWLFGSYVSSTWGAVIGAVYVLGRCLYAAGYIKDPAKRGSGFNLSLLSVAALLFGALFGVVRALLGH